MYSLEACVAAHYQSHWLSIGSRKEFSGGPFWELPSPFHILEFPPSSRRSLWTYATCGMSRREECEGIELHMFSPEQAAELVELLTAVAHYHFFGAPLGVGHTVRFGRPWLENSPCNCGVISLPYLDGTELEHLSIGVAQPIRCLWLLPITASERQFKVEHGLEALESRFDEASVDYANPQRVSVV